jgi:uncharacterized protein (TIGR00369 family)
VTDSRGQLIALCRQHGRWISTLPTVPPAGDSLGEQATAPADTVPPADLAELLGAEPRAAEGGAELELAVVPGLANPLGNLHGGITLCACDLVAQVALQAVAGPSRTAFIHVAYARPIPVGTKTRFEGRIVHGGRSFAVVQVTAVNESGKPCAFATVTTSDQGARR